MRRLEKLKARELRQQGKSIKEIEKLLGVRRSSISVWVRDVRLTVAQKERLMKGGHSLAVTEKRRQSRLAHETNSRQVFLRQGLHDVTSKHDLDLFALGVGLYWGEGSKTTRGSIELSNTDARIIQLFALFLRQTCGVPLTKIHARVGLHAHISTEKAERYWTKVSGIPRKQFQKTSIQRSAASRGERDRLPYGTFTIGVYDTAMRIRLEGWIQGTYKRFFPTEFALHDITKLQI